MNLNDEIEKLTAEGYSEANAAARLCQDIILQGISNSSLNRNITVKGGVVMRSISKNARRATQDVDIDFIRYSLEDESITKFIQTINTIPGIRMKMTGRIENLNHQDYKGKRVHISVNDEYGNTISSKVDIGVHKDLDILQDEYCFDICYSDDGASLLMNTPAQMITEKLKSLLRFGTGTTRYKDIFDIYYLIDKADHAMLSECINRYIYDDDSLSVSTKNDIVSRLTTVFNNKTFLGRLNKSNKNWLDEDITNVFSGIIDFFNNQV